MPYLCLWRRNFCAAGGVLLWLVQNKHSFRGFIYASGAMLILYQTKKNPLHRSHNSHHKQNHNSHVNKFFSLPFVAVITNHEAYRCSARNSSGAARPCGAATPRNSDAHERIAVPKALCALRDSPRPRPKSGKVCRSDTRPGDVGERAERSESSDTTPIRNAPCFGV